MATDARDREALDLIATRTFADCALVALELDMQTRRFTLRVYGSLRSADATVLATLTFFGTRGLATGGATAAFPSRAQVATLDVTYADDDETGSVDVRGRVGWTLAFTFEGIAYQEHPAVLASLVDDE